MAGVSSGASCFLCLALFRVTESLYGSQLMCWGKVSVATRHGDRLVAHEFLHGSQVNTCHYQAAGKGVSKTVPREVLNFSLLNSWFEPMPRTG